MNRGLALIIALSLLHSSGLAWIFTKDQTSQINSCIQSVCGKPTENWGLYAMPNRPGGPNRAVVERFDEEIKPQIEAVLASARALVELQKQESFTKATRDYAFDPKDPLWVFFLFQPFRVKMGLNTTWVDVDQQTFLVKPKLKAIKDEMNKILPGPADLFAENYAEFLRFHAQDLIWGYVDPSLSALERRLLAVSKKGDRPETLVNDASQILDLGERLDALFQAKLFDLLAGPTKNIFLKASKGQKLSAAEADLYVDRANRLQILDILYMDTLLVEKVRQKKNKWDWLKALWTNLKLPRKVSLMLTPESLVKECKESILTSLDRNASELRYQQLQKAFPIVREQAKRVALEMAGDAETRRAIESLDEMTLVLPSKNLDRWSKVKGTLDNLEADLAAYRKLVVEAGPKMVQVTTVVDMLLANKDTSFDRALTEIQAACDGMPKELSTDFTIPQFKRVSLSWYAANYLDRGISILAHELGHQVSYLIRTASPKGQSPRFNQSWNCVANRNPNEKTKAQDAQTRIEHSYVEEDWADHFAWKVIKSLEGPAFEQAQSVNPWCSLIQMEKLNYKETLISTDTSNASVKHSSGFLRFLMMSSDQGRVTQACAPFLKEFESKGKKLKCE